MRCELPVLRRCCFCFPLRIGLLVWAYFKQIVSLSFLIFVIVTLCKNHRKIEVESGTATVLILTLMTLDMMFHVLFIVSAHKKDYKNMRIFYRYSIVILSVNLIVCVVLVGALVYYSQMAPFIIFFIFVVWYMMPFLLTSLILCCIQGYLIILVRSEFIKLKNNSQFEFVNNAAEEKCTAKLGFVEEIPITI